MGKIKTAREEYEEQLEQAKEDTKKVIESTEGMIDMPFYEFTKFLEGQNVGVLRAFRALLQMHLDKADVLAKNLVENKVLTFNRDDRVKLGSVFGIITKIQDRMGYIDYLIEKNSIK